MNKRGPAVRKRPPRKAGTPAKQDRRTKRTRHTLGTALTDLMVTRRFDAITVQEIIDRANIGRSTFYAHFRNKDDLFLNANEQLFDSMELAAGKMPGRRLVPVAELFAHTREQADFVKALRSSGKMALVRDFGTARIAQIIERRVIVLEKGAPRDVRRLRLVSRLLAAAMFELHDWWLDRADAPSAVDADRMFHEFAWSALGGTDGTSSL
jgi:AcrR family transcriptional regulator